MLISILTPVYNRSHLLEKLFQSLKSQTSHDFEWVIVDDGSTDDLNNKKNNFNTELFPVKYLYKNNGGKHTALNTGVDACNGKWVLIVDSDDLLTNDAIEQVKINVESINELGDGVIFLKASPDLKVLGQPHKSPGVRMHANTLVAMKGDKAYLFKKSVFSEIKFPVHEDEKFVTESYLWNKIFDKGKSYAIGVNKVIYIAEYLPGGLTDNYLNLLKQNPKGTMDFVFSNLNLNEVKCNIIKQAAYHFIPICNTHNLIHILKKNKPVIGLKFMIILFLMKIKIKWK